MPTREQLIAFEKRVAAAFAEKQIRAPIHLSGGNEDQLIEIFRNVQPGDYVFSNWRSHYHALLKGIPEEWVISEILAGRSMHLMSKEHRFISSAIVGGMLPIACGVALGIKLNGRSERCHVFVGDMTARTGLFHEFKQYCQGHHLPVRIVIEDNGFSTNAPTEVVWGTATAPLRIDRYDYTRKYPHCGLEQYVAF